MAMKLLAAEVGDVGIHGTEMIFRMVPIVDPAGKKLLGQASFPVGLGPLGMTKWRMLTRRRLWRRLPPSFFADIAKIPSSRLESMSGEINRTTGTKARIVVLRIVSYIAGGALFAVIVAIYIVRGWRRVQEGRTLRARELFHRRREWLEAEFLSRAGRSGRPRGLEWVDCDFDDHVAFARRRQDGQLHALVAVTIRFEAVIGGDMEHVEAVGNLRSATAVFRFDRDHWETEGRTVFNLSPEETIQHFAHELEEV
jgi:hypothetical protein